MTEPNQHQALLDSCERELISARIDIARLEEQLQTAGRERDEWRDRTRNVTEWWQDAKEQLETAGRVVDAARLLTRRDTFDMRIVQVREDNLLDALREYDTASSPAMSPQNAESRPEGRLS